MTSSEPVILYRDNISAKLLGTATGLVLGGIAVSNLQDTLDGQVTTICAAGMTAGCALFRPTRLREFVLSTSLALAIFMGGHVLGSYSLPSTRINELQLKQTQGQPPEATLNLLGRQFTYIQQPDGTYKLRR